ncbi:MAG: FliM/FliN family flagellar motor switch protein [Phycisphaerales bacterium]|nr:FliM/FliN family flagellar motor switch protein [Phycisphaerales bacterium]
MSSEIQAILNLEVPVIVRLGERQMSLREVLTLVPGSIIEIPKPADDELDLMINNQRIGVGTAVKVGENFGIKITAIGAHEAIAKAIAKRLQEKFDTAA